jgi:hypothetical protein
MMRFKQIFVSIVVMLFTVELAAQVNIQTFYDFGSDRQNVTLTLEMFKGDRWGNTFFFVDQDFFSREIMADGSAGKIIGPAQSYLEISRSLNFWSESKLRDLSLQVEYNGGLCYVNQGSYGFTINSAFLAGVNYCIHNENYSNTLTLQVLYKHIVNVAQVLPMQFTAVWEMADLFHLRGLTFRGFADIWWERSTQNGVNKEFVFVSEPQLWYNVGRHFGADNLHLGAEVELALNFANVHRFMARPCVGFKWDF